MGIVEKMRLDGKKGFVTGAARGIGKCTAFAFAEAGADIAVVDLDLGEAEETAAEIAKATGRKVIAIKCDVTDEAQVQAMVDEVANKLGGLDFCHANAGICINAPADEMTYAQWKKNIDVNLNSVFLTDTIAGRYMLAHGGGSIINTASMSAHIVNVPQPQCAYNASKAGVIHQIPCGRVGEERRSRQQHQSRIYWNRPDTVIADTAASDRAMERDGAHRKTGQAGRTPGDLRLSRRRSGVIHDWR